MLSKLFVINKIPEFFSFILSRIFLADAITVAYLESLGIWVRC